MIKLIPKKKQVNSIQNQTEQQQEQMKQNWKDKINNKIELNVEKVNKEYPSIKNNRPKPTIINPTIRGVKKKYAENGTKLISRFKK